MGGSSRRVSHRQRYVASELCAYSIAPTDEAEGQLQVTTVTWQPTREVVMETNMIAKKSDLI